MSNVKENIERLVSDAGWLLRVQKSAPDRGLTALAVAASSTHGEVTDKLADLGYYDYGPDGKPDSEEIL